MFKGSITALVTPFANGAVDEGAFQRLVEWQISEGSNGVVPCGTTGESPTLSHKEHKRVVELTVEAAKRRVPVIAGAGSNNTIEAIELATHAERAGPMRYSSWRPITISRRKKEYTSTLRRSTLRSAFPSSSTTFLPGASLTSQSTRWRASSATARTWSATLLDRPWSAWLAAPHSTSSLVRT